MLIMQLNLNKNTGCLYVENTCLTLAIKKDKIAMEGYNYYVLFFKKK